MTEKVQVNKQLKGLIDKLLVDYTTSEILLMHANSEDNKWIGEWEILNAITMEEMAKILINGYEWSKFQEIRNRLTSISKDCGLGHAIEKVYGYAIFREDEKLSNMWYEAETLIDKIHSHIELEYQVDIG